jgi:hypothetical protein
MAACVGFSLLHDPSYIRTNSPYTCDPGVPIRDGRRSVEALGSISTLEDVNRVREFVANTEFRPLICPLLSGPQIRHPPDRPHTRKGINERKIFNKLEKIEKERREVETKLEKLDIGYNG